MKAILINAKNQTVSEVETNGTLNEIYKFVGCKTIDVVSLFDSNHHIYVDDEGWLTFRIKRPYGFTVGNQTIVGNGLIFADSIDGEERSCTLDVELVRKYVKFNTPLELLRYGTAIGVL